jgi:hypothetical protein
MSTIVNKRDVLLHTTTPRLIDTGEGGNLISLTATSSVFKVSGGSGSPASIVLTAFPANPAWTVNWAIVTGAATLTGTGNTRTLTYANMTTDNVAIQVSVSDAYVVDGITLNTPTTYTDIVNITKVLDGTAGANGFNGQRGSLNLYASGSTWSDATANAAVLAATGAAAKVIGDVVTISNGGTFAAVKGWSGTAWIPTGQVIDGSLIVTNSVKAAAIDTTGLTLRDAAGNVFLNSGAGLSFGDRFANTSGVPEDGATVGALAGVNLKDAAGTIISESQIKNNLIDLSGWVAGIASNTMPWVMNGEYNEITSSYGSPKGNSDLVWYCKETTNDGQAGGGWDASPFDIDKTKTYRFVVPIKRLSGSGTAYWGVFGVADLNTNTGNGNPYFVYANNSEIVDGRWYLFVGYLYPAGSTNNSNAGAGIFDCTTGELVKSGFNYNQLPDGSVGHRAYQFYASNGAEQLFGRPMVNLVDGTEPSLREFFAPAAVLNSSLVPSINKASGDNLWTGDFGNVTATYGGGTLAQSNYPDAKGTNTAVVLNLPSSPAFVGWHILNQNGAPDAVYKVTIKVQVVAGMSIVVATTDASTWTGSNYAIANTTSTTPVWVTVSMQQKVASWASGLDVLVGANLDGYPVGSTIGYVAVCDLVVTRDESLSAQNPITADNVNKVIGAGAGLKNAELIPSISAAQTAANTANAALANVASDSILSPSEKPSVVQDYNVITSEQAGIDAQAMSYGITTEKANYDNAIGALGNYLGGLSGWNTIPGSDVVIDGYVFRSKFADVYTAKQSLLNKIAARAKEIADAAQGAANAAQGTANTAGSTANTALTNANNAQGTANTALNAANSANSSLGDKLSKSAGDVLSGSISLQASGAIVVGNAGFSNGNFSGTGVVVSSNGIAAIAGGAAKFILYNDGNAYFGGSMYAGNININNKFIVNADGSTIIKSATSGQRMELTSSMLQVFDGSGTLRVRLGVW